jgi:hypothetical protein
MERRLVYRRADRKTQPIKDICGSSLRCAVESRPKWVIKDVSGVPMDQARPITRWAVISLISSILGCLGFAGLPALYSYGMHQETTGVSAGIAVSCAGLLSGTVCLSGVVCGIAALRGLRGTAGRGRGLAWSGIVLGCLPLVVLLAYLVPVLWEALWDWIGRPVPKKALPI